VGGMISKSGMEEVLNEGFMAFQLARPLIYDTDFINKIKEGIIEKSECKHSNYCIGRMYSVEMKCHHCVDELPKKLRKEVEKNERMWRLDD
jgi:2,4-dienoyl-CoA reductase-like NADH-dependent reductase (Old Yellow Enzyme family)